MKGLMKMKKISVLLFIVLSFIVFNMGIDVKAEGLNEPGEYLICAYGDGNNMLYLVKNKEADMRLYGNEVENIGIDNSNTYLFSPKDKGQTCNKYLHVSLEGSDHVNPLFTYYFFIFDDNSSFDVATYSEAMEALFYVTHSPNFDFVHIRNTDIELLYQYGTDESESVLPYAIKNSLEEYKSSNPNSSDKEEQEKNIDSGCSVDHSSDLACGSLYFIPKEIPFFTNLIMNLIKIATPIILVIKGSIDLIKAMTGGNEQEISKSRSKFYKRLIPAVLVFLIILVVQFIFGLFATDSENNTFLGCTNCFLNNKCSYTPQSKIDEYCSDNGQGEVVNPDGYNPGDGGQGSNPGGNTTVDNKTLREKIATFALNVALRSSNDFIYLVPDERDASKLTSISNLGSVIGGNCLRKTYNGEKCLTYGDRSYYGTDCNGFVGYVYHKSANFESSDSKFFAPNTATGSWDLLSSASKYFTKYSSTFSVDSDGLAKLKSVIEKGDAIARICKKEDGTYSTHIGIYVGGTVNNIVDNAGWTNSRTSPIKNRTFTDFLGSNSDCTLTLFQLK